MAVWSVVKVSEFGGAFRMDAEFWRPEYIAVEKTIGEMRHAKLGDLVASIRKGVFNILAESYQDQGVPFYRSANVGEIIPKDADCVFISPKRHAEEHKTALYRGDLMLAKTGKEATSVVLTKECNVSQDVVAVRPDRKKINPFYLAVFLNTGPGILQMRRWFQGPVQMHLSLPDTRQIMVPLPDPVLQKEVEELVVKSETWIKQSSRCMEAAETNLLSALGMDHIDLFPSRSYSRTFQDLLEEGRFDAEFFHPRPQAILNQLRRSGVTIGDAAQLAERIFRLEQQKNGSTFRYIEIGSLTSVGEAEPETIAVAEAPSRAQFIVRPGDIITSTVRPIRRLSALIRPDQDGCVCSSGFAVLSPSSSEGGIESEVLLAYLRLPIVCEILDLYCTASMYPAIPVDRLLKVPVMVPEKRVRTKIVENVRAALFASQEAARLLETGQTNRGRYDWRYGLISIGKETNDRNLYGWGL